MRRGVTIPAEDSQRLDSQCARILARLQQGPATNAELAAISLKYTGRLHEVRLAGHRIECERRSGGVHVYTLIVPAPARAEQLEMFA
jgi:hypothetical protein